MKFFHYLLLFIIFLLSQFIAFSQQKPIIIDHNSLENFRLIDDSTLDKAIQLRMMFRHASIGFAIMDGIECLQGTKPQVECKVYPQYKYDSRNWSFQGRGNSGWYGKVDDFVTEVEKQINEFDVFAFKYCYLDGLDELAEPCGKPLSNEKINKAFSYLKDNMEMLENKFKNKIFVWWTIPLTQLGQLCTDTLNRFIRNYCNQNNKILFDIADIECHDTLGYLVTNENGLQKAFKPYCGEQKPDAAACHPNRKGALIIAKCLWVMLSEIIDRKTITSIKYPDYYSEPEIIISPNPSYDFLDISFINNSYINSFVKSISVYDALGKTIISYKNDSNLNKITFSLNDFSSGVYYCIIDSGNQIIFKTFCVLK